MRPGSDSGWHFPQLTLAPGSLAQRRRHPARPRAAGRPGCPHDLVPLLAVTPEQEDNGKAAEEFIHVTSPRPLLPARSRNHLVAD